MNGSISSNISDACGAYPFIVIVNTKDFSMRGCLSEKLLLQAVQQPLQSLLVHFLYQ
jgi:hypothetical protein